MHRHHYLFLQGPHGPFFHRLGQVLKTAGARVTRVGFNSGDRAFWRDAATYVPFTDPHDMWPDTCARLIEDRGITDLVLYGDVRAVHATAIDIAKSKGVTVHVFEEGYLRPYWVTYERDGANGHSRLMSLGIPDMRGVLRNPGADDPEPPATWGDMREHIFYGALYHWFVLFWNGSYPHFKSHRRNGLRNEAVTYTRRLMSIPKHALERGLASRRIRRSGLPFHLALMQLDHDTNYQQHGPFDTNEDFARTVIRGFAAGAPEHHQLVFKAHPLESAPGKIKRMIARLAAAEGLPSRVHFVHGGKLAKLLDHAHSAVTVNSTAGQQALWRGIPIKVFGQVIYDKPELVSPLPIEAFFANPKRPDMAAYRDFRKFLLETSQLPGGYYSAKGRRQLLRLVVDRMLAPHGPYDALVAPDPGPADPSLPPCD